jgi:type I restriction enzyme S subunit
MTEFKHLRPEDLPKGWTVSLFKDLATYNLGRTPPRNAKQFWTDGVYPWVSIADMSPYGIISDTKEKVSEEAHSKLYRRRLVPAGAFLMSFKLTIGRVARLGIPAYHNEAIISIFPKNRDILLDDYLFYYLSQIDYAEYQDTAVKGMTLNRGKIDKLEIALPPLREQRRIAHVLSTVQTAVEQQARLIALTRELKSALMRKLFTEGLHGEKQKETEIGLVPESWEVMPLGEIMDGTPKNGMYKPLEAYGSGTLILRIYDFSNEGDIVASASNRINADESEISTYTLQEDDIVTNRVNSLSHLGKTALVGELVEPMLFESNMMKYRVDKTKALPSYIMRLLNSPIGKLQIVARAKRAVAQSSINQGSLKAVLLPIPRIEVQEEIVNIIDIVIENIEVHGKRKTILEELFRTLLHQLMTGQIRVNEIDLPGLS